MTALTHCISECSDMETRRGDRLQQETTVNSFSRRGFIRSAAILTAAAATSSFVTASEDPAAAENHSIKLGLASYTFRNFDRMQLIAFMKQLNIGDLNAKDTKNHLPADTADEANALKDYAANGIGLHAAGTVYFDKDDDADIRSKFDYCKRAGIKVVVAGDPTPANLPRIEKYVKEYDIQFAIHNHGPEDKLWHSPLDVLKAVRAMDGRMGCCMDVGHAARAGVDVVKAIHEVGPRLFNVHMKDLTDFKSKESQVAVGEGIMPVAGIFKALEAIRYKGFVDLEYEIHGDDPMPGVMTSFAFMRGVLAGMSSPVSRD